MVQIHRGFLSDEVSKDLSDQEVLANVPDNKGSVINRPDGTQESRVSPFTYRWVKKHVKSKPSVTAYELLVLAGFK